MAGKGRPENLVPLTTESARILGSLGGKKSAEVRREKKMFEQKFADFFGKKSLDDVFNGILNNHDSSSVALLKLASESVDGKHSNIDHNVSIQADKSLLESLLGENEND